MSEKHDAVQTGLLSLAAYGALIAQARLAKDADQAPQTWEHIDMCRLLAKAWELFVALENRASNAQVDLVQGVETYEGIVDDFDARTRPTTWYERLVKTYVALGLFTDTIKGLGQIVQDQSVVELVSDFGHGQWVCERLEAVCQKDEQLRARLSLWGRRVAGEAMGLVEAFLFTHPEFGDREATHELLQQVGKASNERLRALHLAA